MEQNNYIDEPLVTVIISSYNHEAYIEESVLSIINQTYKNIELIIIDDGSIDNSREILQNLQKRYGFELIFQENQGLAKTLNNIFSNYAHGKYFTGCASDDFIMPDKIEKQVKFFEENPDYDMVFGKAYIVDGNGKIIENFEIFEPFDEPVKYIPFELLIENNRIPGPTKMMRREIWETCGGHNENTIIEDFDMALKIAYYGKIAYINDYFGYYRWHGQNVSTQALKIYTATWELVNSWKDKMSPDVAKRVLARRDSITFCILSSKYKKESLRYLKLNQPYWDSFMIKNYIKGIFKLLFTWKHNSIWK